MSELSARRIWPLIGYAPGEYSCRCSVCNEGFWGDKRAIHCLDCAVERANQIISAAPTSPPGGPTLALDEPKTPHHTKEIESLRAELETARKEVADLTVCAANWLDRAEDAFGRLEPVEVQRDLLWEALEPFAAYARVMDCEPPFPPDNHRQAFCWSNEDEDLQADVTAADFRRASEALATCGGGGKDDMASVAESGGTAQAPKSDSLRDLDKLACREMTDAELVAEEERVGRIWDDTAAALEESGGAAGSPMEWMSERFDEIATEQARRATSAEVGRSEP